MNYNFSNLLGASYRGGSVILRGNELVSPVGNRIQVLDLSESLTSTLRFESNEQIRVVCASPCGQLLLTFDEGGNCCVINKTRNALLHRIPFGNHKIRAAKFSPDGKFVAVGVGRKLEVWKRPCHGKVASPMEIHRTYYGCQADITAVDWTEDSFGIAVGSKDQTCRIYTLEQLEGFRCPILSHRRPLVDLSFTSPSFQRKCTESGLEAPVYLITTTKEGAVYEWSFESLMDDDGDDEDQETVQMPSKGQKRKAESEFGESDDDVEAGSLSSTGELPTDEAKTANVAFAGVPDRKKNLRKRWCYFPGKWNLVQKHSFRKDYQERLTSWDFHKSSGLMVGAFSNGMFELIQMPGFERLQVLSVCQHRLTSVSFGSKGDWIAVGSAELGQLLVWEWRTETYALKQQGHHFDVSTTAFSPDGALIATGADDSKVKIYSANSGLCFATFTEHTMPVTGIQFMPSGHALCSASKDGTVRAYDLVRYRNFRTFTTPEPVQFVCIAVDPKGDVVVAGSQDTFQICVWSIKTGRLLDMLAAHEGPVVGLSFSPSMPILVSASWDKGVKIWDVFSNNKASIDTLHHNHEVLAIAYRPNGKQIATATFDGNINFWDAAEGENTGLIEGRRDIYRGRYRSDRRIANAFSVDAYFTTLVYGADGTHILAGGRSKYVCIYDVEDRVLLRRIQITHNRSLDGVIDRLNSRFMSESGPLSWVDDDDSGLDDDAKLQFSLGADSSRKLPGTAKRGKKPIAQSRCIALSPNGGCFAVAATEGLLVYTLENRLVFDPTDLTEEITPAAVEAALESGSTLTAILIALRLRDDALIEKCLLATPLNVVPIVAKGLPSACIGLVLSILARTINKSAHLEFLLLWAKSILCSHGVSLNNPSSAVLSALKSMQKAMSQLRVDLGTMCEDNLHTLSYLAAAGARRKLQIRQKIESGGEETDVDIKC